MATPPTLASILPFVTDCVLFGYSEYYEQAPPGEYQRLGLKPVQHLRLIHGPEFPASNLFNFFAGQTMNSIPVGYVWESILYDYSSDLVNVKIRCEDDFLWACRHSRQKKNATPAFIVLVKRPQKHCEVSPYQ